MRLLDLLELLGLAALWGASFLFMRVAAPEFGPPALVFVRVGLAALCLLPLLMWREGLGPLRQHGKPLLVVGLLNSALPFCLFTWALLSINAGLGSILNATAPLWGALVAWLWLKTPLPSLRALGLLIGFVGVALLAGEKASFKAGGSGWAIVACLLATLSYGIAANYTKRHLMQVSPLAVSTGSMLGATLLLLPLALLWWPAQLPGLAAWASVLALALFCTALAYIMYFRLIGRLGPARAIAVTFLIPLFGVSWGALLLGEAVTLHMAMAGAVVLFGTAMALGLIGKTAK